MERDFSKITTANVRKQGGSYVITLDKNFVDLNEIGEADIISLELLQKKQKKEESGLAGNRTYLFALTESGAPVYAGVDDEEVTLIEEAELENEQEET